MRHRWDERAHGFRCALCGMKRTFRKVKNPRSRFGYSDVMVHIAKDGTQTEGDKVPPCSGDQRPPKKVRAVGPRADGPP